MVVVTTFCADVTATDLAVHACNGALQSVNLDPHAVDTIVVGMST